MGLKVVGYTIMIVAAIGAIGSCVNQPTHFAEVSAVGNVDHPAYEKSELLVADPPEGFMDHVGEFGFSIIEKVDLLDLGITLYRLQVPARMDVPEARDFLKERFPSLVVDANPILLEAQ